MKCSCIIARIPEAWILTMERHDWIFCDVYADREFVGSFGGEFVSKQHSGLKVYIGDVHLSLLKSGKHLLCHLKYIDTSVF